MRYLMLIVALLIWPAGTAGAGPPEFTVMTFNLRSTADQSARRLPVIQRFLERERPDVVLLQEVGRSPDGEANQAEALARAAGYTIAGVHNRRTRRGLAILSRHPIVDVVRRWLPMRRRPMLGVVIERGGERFSFVNVHLSPQLWATKMRHAELTAALQLMKSMPGTAFIGGDFNFGDRAPENELLRGMTDVFREVAPTRPGYTWDRARNPLADKNSYTRERSRRLDRILTDSDQVQVLRSEIVLDRRIRPGLFPSDHFALLAGILTRNKARRRTLRGSAAGPQVRAPGDARGSPPLPAKLTRTAPPGPSDERSRPLAAGTSCGRLEVTLSLETRRRYSSRFAPRTTSLSQTERP